MYTFSAVILYDTITSSTGDGAGILSTVKVTPVLS